MIVVYSMIPNTVNIKFQVYLQMPREKYILIAENFHMILIFFSSKFIYLICKWNIWWENVFSFQVLKYNCLLLTSLFWIVFTVFEIHACTFHFKYYGENLAWWILFLERSTDSKIWNQKLKIYSNGYDIVWLLTVIMHENSRRNPAP